MRDAPLRPEASHAESSFVSDTSTNTSSTGTSSTASGSTFTLPSSAPTPYNTYISPAHEDVFGSTSRPSLTSSGEAEYIREPPILGKDNGGTSIQPGRSVSFLSNSSRPTPTSSRHPSSLSSRAGSSHHLLPYSPPIRDPQIQSFMVPVSDRPIPLPPLQLADTGSSPPSTPTDHDGKTYTSSSLYRQPSSVISTPSASTSHKASLASRLLRRKSDVPSDKKTQEDRDALRLQQLGYDAVLGRDYTFWSSLAISWLNIGCIQGTVYAVSGAYSFGGPMMILIMWPLSGLWTIFLTLALAELASVYPVSGAMASWAWKVARGGVGYERWWAWLMGGVVLGGHVASVLLVTWQLVNIIHGVMGLAFDYMYQPWHGILFFLTVLLVCGLLGSQSWGRSHKFWMGAGMYGVSVWLILCVSLISAGARHSHSVSADLFLNKTGWESKPYVFILGWSYCTIASGHDASAHMAEETQNPSRNVPNAMVAAMALTYICGMISISLLLLSIDPQDARTVSEHTFAVGYILTQAINRQGAIAICCLLIFTLTVQIMAQLQASSRFVFAMARDNAMPFAASIRRTNASKQPIVAHWVVIALCAPFSILVLAGKGPVYSVLAVTASTLSYMGYTTPVLLYLLSGKDLRTEGRSSWSLRRKSKIIGTVGVVYGIAVIAISTAPGSYPVTIENISWSPVILVGTVLVCFITWRYYGTKHYSGPIKAVTKWETGVEIDLQSTLTTQRSKPSGPPIPTFSHPDGYEEGQEDLIKDVLPDGGGVVLVESATTNGTGTEWTDATDTTEGTGSTFTRDTLSRMGGVELSSADLGVTSTRSR